MGRPLQVISQLRKTAVSDADTMEVLLDALEESGFVRDLASETGTTGESAWSGGESGDRDGHASRDGYGECEGDGRGFGHGDRCGGGTGDGYGIHPLPVTCVGPYEPAGGDGEGGGQTFKSGSGYGYGYGYGYRTGRGIGNGDEHWVNDWEDPSATEQVQSSTTKSSREGLPLTTPGMTASASSASAESPPEFGSYQDALNWARRHPGQAVVRIPNSGSSAKPVGV
jgi:hypothetical protein